jgi:tetratricopeptide (TPR) repeat protein
MATKKKTAPPAKPLKKAAPASGKTLAAVPAGPSPAALQLKAFEQAVQLFTSRRYEQASAQFREAARGPAVHIADKARSYVQICERQTARITPDLRTAEDHFNYGVERLNAGDIPVARTHLSRALGMQPNGDHILYTLALCCGLAGDGDAACENLKRAIDIEPRNRILARQDPEFTALVGHIPSLRSLLGSGELNS